MTESNNQTKYTGPAEPIPTHSEPISDRAEMIWFVVLFVVFITMLALGLLEVKP
jgi:hypothetical protein